jgi:uncharacterized membrane-anchored protein YitT (DUF2179 family)
MKTKIQNILGIILGTVITSVGIVGFLSPNEVTTGGFSGISIMLHYLFDLQIGKTLLILNLPLFIIGFKELGFWRIFYSIIGVMSISFWTDFLPSHLSALTTDPLLATIYGGTLIVIGLGIVFNFGGTSGGTDIIGKIVEKYTHYTLGQCIAFANVLIVITSGILFEFEFALYAAISVFLSGKMIDFIQQGFNTSKATFIITDNSDEVRHGIYKELGRGVTMINGKGGFTQASAEIILCTLKANEILELKRVVHEVDEGAFVIVTSVHEVLGKGFKDTQIA